MSFGPFDIGPVIESLRLLVPGLRQVGGSADFAAASAASTAVTPSAFVLLASETAAPQRGGSALAVQSIRARFAVVIAARNYRASELGMASSDQLNTMIAAVRQSLLGKAPPGFVAGTATAVDLVSGALLNYAAATLWWQELYETTYWSRA